MSELQLSDVKSHVSGVDDDDLKLQGFIDAAEAHVVNYLRRDMGVDFPDGWPEPIKQAVRLLVAFFYDNRGGSAEENGSNAEVPFWFKELLMPYRDLS